MILIFCENKQNRYSNTFEEKSKVYENSNYYKKFQVKIIIKDNKKNTN